MLLGVDVGGTFTDAVLVSDEGELWSAKSPSTPQAQQLGVMAAVESVLARAGAQPAQVERFAHGMTVATNALLEGRGARTALVVTEGFTDIVELARQARASLYRLCEAGPRPLTPRELRFGAPERMGPDGPLRELNAQASEELVERLIDAQPEAVAVVLLHSYAHPQHEQRLGELIAKRMPRTHVSLSHELVGTFREYERASTTEVDAALSPLLGSYLGELQARTRAQGLPEPQIMQSSGGLTDTNCAASHAALTVLSGPAGGVGGALLLSEAVGERDVLCFDMGGTSCDVCVIDGGSVAETAERTVAGRALALPALDIHTVGAGGGSIAWSDAGGALRVGPQSAGATPGPACYGQGGEQPTVTDANLVLGRLLAEQPLAGTLRLDREAAERAVGALANELGLGLIACAEGIVRVAEAEMLGALAVMTVQRGIDPRRFALMPFGGAGPLHAAAMADRLGIERALCPRACGVLCALGLAAAAPRRDVASTVMLSGTTFTAQRLGSELARLTERAIADLSEAPKRVQVRFELRYRGQSFELGVERELDVAELGRTRTRSCLEDDADQESRLRYDPAHVKDAFERLHEERYGYRDEHGEVELVNMRVSAIGARPALRLTGADLAEERPAEATSGRSPHGVTQVVFDGEPLEAELWRGELHAGTRIEGPALCALEQSTLLVPPGWHGAVDEQGTVLLERLRMSADARNPERPSAKRTNVFDDPIQLQVIVGALGAACEEMGATLVRSAHSANIKERRDASTALFDRRGEMVMQAEHIPVHLGSMPAAVAAVLEQEHQPDASWILNDPFAGGTHLPDITVITPVFADAHIGFAVSRAHHSDVGGRVPGSMPADSRRLEEEGVVISPRPITTEAIEEIVARMRQPQERRADLRAQLAANRIGAQRFSELARRVGVERLGTAMDAVLDYAERRTRACIAQLEDGVRERADVLETPTGELVLRLKATVAGERLTLDFSGSAERHDGNLNCPLAVTLSACWFAVRVLTDPDIPPSAGAYRAVEVIVPEGCLLNAAPSPGIPHGEAPAVAAGNVETSSRVADLVLGAFGQALGQGTMNNLTLGNERFSYYETIGGGQGACAHADGPSAVHVAMSNTLNTPIEALERELPLRVTEYALRRGSGGTGRHRGGDGVIRELQALEEMTFSLISERRTHAPTGADGGEPGTRGYDELIGTDGQTSRRLPAKLTGTLHTGERLRIETPGGGGYGRQNT